MELAPEQVVGQKRLVKSLSSLLKSDGNIFSNFKLRFLSDLLEITLDEFNMLWDDPIMLTQFMQTQILELNTPLLQVHFFCSDKLVLRIFLTLSS